VQTLSLPGFIFWTTALSACGTANVPSDAATDTRRSDGPTRIEASVTGDMDHDGLCDATEVMRRTDITHADTDGDGLLDSLEVAIGSDPLSARDPRASDRLLFRESENGFQTLEHATEFVGSGEVLTATVLDRGAALDGLRVSDIFETSVEATTANPAAFVRAVEGPRFVGVLGRVLLQWRATLRSGPTRPERNIGCRRTYEAQLVIKREGDDIVQTRRILLDIAPQEPPTVRGWMQVSPEGLCLPMRCF
jgi:hypothetical protein